MKRATVEDFPVLSANGLAKRVLNLKTNWLSSSAWLVLAALAPLACATPEVCAELHTCGGDIMAGKTSRTFQFAATCVNDVAATPNVPSLLHQPPPLAGEVPPKRTQVNFCSEMVLSPDKSIKFIQPWFPALPVESGEITYASDGSYTGSINYRGIQQMDFASGCFLSQGFKIVPDDVATTIDTLSCREFTPILKAGLSTQPNISEFACVNDGAAGCQCVYNLLLITAMAGNYVAIGNTLSHSDTLFFNPVSSADYCIANNTLELSGYKRTFLFNQPALRTLQLTESSSK